MASLSKRLNKVQAVMSGRIKQKETVIRVIREGDVYIPQPDDERKEVIVIAFKAMGKDYV